MIYTLENSFIKITASNKGGELYSLKSKGDNTEFLWNGDPTFWKYHAPILFPIVGKVNNLKYKVNGCEYILPQHGLARTSEFNLISKTESKITFELNYSEESLKVYPFKFSLRIKYTLISNSLNISYSVKNLDNKKIYFSIGSHPAFMLPLSKDDVLEDYYFKFNNKETASIMCLNKDGYFIKDRLPFLDNSDTIPLSKELFQKDALVFSHLNSDEISICSKNHSKTLTLNFSNFPYLGLWAPPTGAPFVCIEPWFGHADYEDFNGEFTEKEGILSLEENSIFKCDFSVTI